MSYDENKWTNRYLFMGMDTAQNASSFQYFRNGTFTTDHTNDDGNWFGEMPIYAAHPKESIAVNPEQEKALLGILMVLLEKAGGRITVTEEELAQAKGHVIMGETDAAGLRHVDLLPEYISIGEEEEVPASWEFQDPGVIPNSMKKAAEKAKTTYKIQPRSSTRPQRVRSLWESYLAGTKSTIPASPPPEAGKKEKKRGR